jgi:hypothetical protein
VAATSTDLPTGVDRADKRTAAGRDRASMTVSTPVRCEDGFPGGPPTSPHGSPLRSGPAPSAGFSQGWAFLVLDTAEDIALFRAAARTPEQPERWFAANVHAPLLLGSHADRSRHVPPLLERLRDVAMSRAWIGIAGSPGGS